MKLPAVFGIGTLSFFLYNYHLVLPHTYADVVDLHRQAETNRMDPKPIILVEGIMILHEQVISIPHLFLVGIPPFAL